jgi:cytochrome c oxidase cbb3-type subunit 2
MTLRLALLLLGPLLRSEPGRAPAPDRATTAGDLIWMVGPRDGSPIKPPPPVTTRLRARGRTLYRGHCQTCHGERGDGKGGLADRLSVRPTDFSKGVFKLRSTPTGSLPTDLDLFATISRGMHGTPMQPWSSFPETDRWALVHHLKSFSRRFTDEPTAAPVRVPIAPRETDDIRDQGERLYVQLRCGACHGESGAADGPAREAYLRQGNRQVRIRDFTRGRFIRGSEMEDIYLTLRVGIEGTPMAAYSALSDDELWALAAYVRLLVRERPLHEFPPAKHEASAVPGRSGAQDAHFPGGAGAPLRNPGGMLLANP